MDGPAVGPPGMKKAEGPPAKKLVPMRLTKVRRIHTFIHSIHTSHPLHSLFMHTSTSNTFILLSIHPNLIHTHPLSLPLSHPLTSMPTVGESGSVFLWRSSCASRLLEGRTAAQRVSLSWRHLCLHSSCLYTARSISECERMCSRRCSKCKRRQLPPKTRRSSQRRWRLDDDVITTNSDVTQSSFFLFLRVTRWWRHYDFACEFHD